MLAVLMPSRSKEPAPMLTQGEDVEAHALKERGWSISAIARHLDRDRKTIRGDLNAERSPGRRASTVPDPLGPFEGYIRARFADDHHLWETALFEEVLALGCERGSSPASPSASKRRQSS